MSVSRQNRRSGFRESRTPSGLIVPFHARLSGKVRWQVLDERGVPEVPRNPSGFAIGPVEGVQQSNLITNDGLDAVAAYDVSGSGAGQDNRFRGWLAVGTGSTAPAFTDTALVNEVESRSSDALAVSAVFTNETDTLVDNVWRRSVQVTRGVTVAANRNLTEFGLSRHQLQASGPLHIRELFRDGVGTPVTISLLAGKIIRVDHTMVVELPIPAAWITGTIGIEEYDATNTLILNETWATYYTPASSGADAAAWLEEWWNPTSNLGVALGMGVRIPSFDPFTNWLSETYYIGNFTNDGTALASEAYVPGSHQRLRRATFATSKANSTWVGIMFAYSGTSGRNATLAVNFDPTKSFVKDDTKTVRVGMLSTWARG